MYDFIVIIWRFWGNVWAELETAIIDFSGTKVSIAAIIVPFLIVGMVVAIFWKGAKT